MTTVTLPNALVAGQPENVNALNGNLNAIVTVVNGGLDSTNLAAGGTNDTRLASPNNAIWRTLAESMGYMTNGGISIVAGTYWFDEQTLAHTLSGAAGIPGPIRLDPAGFVVAGKTAKLRLTVTMLTGGAPGVSLTFGIYGVGSLTGTSSINVSLTTALPGSTVTFTTPAAGSQNSLASGAFDFPGAAGQYMFGMSLPSTTASGSAMSFRMQLAISHV